MTFQTSPLQSPPSPGRTWLRILLLVGFFLSLLVGLAALSGLYLLPNLEEETTVQLSDPLLLVEPDRIPPHLALLQLAGAEGDALVRQAATAGESTLAYAILVYDGSLTPSRRANELVRVGRQFLAGDDPVRGIAALNLARSATLFALPMPPLERGQLLANIADGLLLADDASGARQTALQAQHVAAQAAGLLPAQRLQILQAVEPIIRGQGNPEEVQRLDELLRAPGQVPERVALTSRLDQLQSDYPTPPTLIQISADRVIAAQALIDRIWLTGGQDIEPERAALSQALMAEDRLRAETYAGWNNPALQLAQRHRILLDYRNWLLVKLRVAEGGFGVQVAENWSAEINPTRQGLGRVMGELNALVNAQIDEDPDPISQAVLRLEAAQWLAGQAALGLYPNAPLGDLSSRMETTQAELETLSIPIDLPLFFDNGAEPPEFRIARRYE